MKTKKDIQELTAAEAGEVVNDLMEGQYDVDDANREQEKIAAEVLDHKDEDQVEAVIRHMAADQDGFDQSESSTRGSEDPECARINSCGVQSVRNKFSRFGELGLNNEVESNLSLSGVEEYDDYDDFDIEN